MSPRSSLAEAARTRSAILARGAAVASVEGLAGLTIGRLAADLGMSKSGLLGPFGSKESLQLQVVEAAADVFWREIWEPVADRPAGLARLAAVCGSWVRYLADPAFPGGCFFVAAASEFDDRPGPVRDLVLGYAERWHRELREQARRAVADGDLPAGTDPEQLVFELTGLVLALHQALRLRHDPDGVSRACRGMARLLGVPVQPTA
ncbi:TetR/AcrR family transcriptional regulator [Micromonospora sp. CPCC 205711]|uniref:TetR/AcrR family transcriptional regulator n=1 Tax=Micromonospora sp. CPCC 205547 TaxID=3122400 RepID=UPI002FF1AAF5